MPAENLRVEVVNLWRDATTDPNSVVMVTHNINEAVFMATRIVVLGTNPGQVRTILDNPLPYPREYHDPAFVAIADRIHDILTSALIPDEPVVAPVAPPTPAVPRTAHIEAFPNANVGEVTGLMERVDAAGGTTDIFDLSVEVGKEFGKVLALVKTAELLDFVDTPKHTVTMTPLGKRFLAAKVNERKRLLNQQLRTLQLFQSIIELLQRQETLSVDEDVLLEELAVWLPTERPQTIFRTLIRWARYAELLGYNADAKKVYLDVEGTAAPAQLKPGKRP